MGHAVRSTDSRLHHKPDVSRTTFSAEVGAHRLGLVSHGDRAVGYPCLWRSGRRGRPPPRISGDRVALSGTFRRGREGKSFVRTWLSASFRRSWFHSSRSSCPSSFSSPSSAVCLRFPCLG